MIQGKNPWVRLTRIHTIITGYYNDIQANKEFFWWNIGSWSSILNGSLLIKNSNRKIEYINI